MNSIMLVLMENKNMNFWIPISITSLTVRGIQTVAAGRGAAGRQAVVHILTALWRFSDNETRWMNTDADVTVQTNLPAIMMCLVTLLFMSVWLLKARQVYSPLWPWLTLDSSNRWPVTFTSSPLTAHWSCAGGVDCAEQSMVRLVPAGKEVEFWPFTVRAMLSGPSEEEERGGESQTAVSHRT